MLPLRTVVLAALASAVVLVISGAILSRPHSGHAAGSLCALLLLIGVAVGSARLATSWRDVVRLTVWQALASMALAIALQQFSASVDAPDTPFERLVLFLAALTILWVLLWLAPVSLCYAIRRGIARWRPSTSLTAVERGGDAVER